MRPGVRYALAAIAAASAAARCMLVGRLELFTVYVLFVPRFWRD